MMRRLNLQGVAMGKKHRIKWWFTVSLVAALLVVVGIYSTWSSTDQREASEAKVLGEARILAEQMGAVWDYVDMVQGAINYNADGHYDFKGVYCSVAGKSIARMFTQKTDCAVRYTRENPRTGSDAPDEFERAALTAFAQGDAEYYGVVSEDGVSVFRYLRAIPVKHGCLTCHGEPRGELDETGYPREGYKLGDLAGAVSLAIPMEVYEAEARQRSAANVGLFVVLAAVIVLCSVTVNAVLSRQSRQMEAMNDKLEETNDHLAQVNDALVRESEYKSTFLATMSHELRTPLASTIALVDLWEREGGGDPDEHGALMRDIRENAANLLCTINNTLDAASLEAQRYRVDVAPLDVLDLVNAVDQVIAPLAEEKGVSFGLSVDPHFPLVLIDASIVHKILMNLLSNAIKFTDPGGSVRLSVSLVDGEDRRGEAGEGIAESEGAAKSIGVGRGSDDEKGGTRSSLLVRVSDTGIGIPQEELAAVFERFRQADSSISRRYGGSGLGLALVKEMAELLGGTADVKSEVGAGSLFTVRLPCEVVEGQ